MGVLHVFVTAWTMTCCLPALLALWRTAGNKAYYAAKLPGGFVLITRLSSHAICDATQARSI